MKNNLLRTFFEWALITSVLMSVGFFAWFWLKTRAVRSYNSQIASAQAGIQNNHAVMTVLINECREYAKTNADMARLLGSEGVPSIAPSPAPATINKPRGK
jgi:Tfp pilus assembly protein PilV